MALITVNLRLVRPQGTNDAPDPATGRVDFIPAAHGKYHNSLRTVEKVTSQIDAEGEMIPVELTPALWKVTISPSKGNPWPEMLFELTEGMPEPVNLAELLPQTVVNGVQLAKGDPGPSIVSWEDNEDGTIKFLLSDGSYTDSGILPRGPQGMKGDQGPIGPIGPQGAEGPKGDQGVQGPIGPAGMTWRGIWDPEEDYINDDSVYHEGSSWFAAGDPEPGEEPSTDSAHWHALALQGAQGIQGSQGIQGPEGPQGPVGLTGPAPELAWEGTSLVIDGGEPVDLKGEQGDQGIQGPIGPKGDTGTPGAVPSSTDYLVVGTGRPDVPDTTSMTSAQLTALPVGCEYRSTDGASVGAWVWRKRPTGWVVTDGDTGWCSVGENGATVYARMTLTHVEAYVVTLSPSSSIQWSIPTEWRQSGPWGGVHANARVVGFVSRGNGTTSPLYFSEPYPYELKCEARNVNHRGVATWPRSASTWPTTLPGTPA